MYDNKVRLSKDVIDKAEEIAQEWGLKNARAAIEAVFRKYADEYSGRTSVDHAPRHQYEVIIQSPGDYPNPNFLHDVAQRAVANSLSIGLGDK